MVSWAREVGKMDSLRQAIFIFGRSQHHKIRSVFAPISGMFNDDIYLFVGITGIVSSIQHNVLELDDRQVFC